MKCVFYKSKLSFTIQKKLIYSDSLGATREFTRFSRRDVELAEEGLASGKYTIVSLYAGAQYLYLQAGDRMDGRIPVNASRPDLDELRVFETKCTDRQAMEPLAEASNAGDGDAAYVLSRCLSGYGCQKDPARALQLFREVDYTSDLLNYGLGTIYTEGLGVPQDIKKGVEYFQKAKDYAPAQEALLQFKKTLFGKWGRR